MVALLNGTPWQLRDEIAHSGLPSWEYLLSYKVSSLEPERGMLRERERERERAERKRDRRWEGGRQREREFPPGKTSSTTRFRASSQRERY